MTQHLVNDQIKHIAQLAAIPITDQEAAALAASFDETLAVIENLQTVDVSTTEPTHQVTGLENVLRDDVVNQQKMFTQAQALANAAETHQGFIVVPQVIDQGE